MRADAPLLAILLATSLLTGNITLVTTSATAEVAPTTGEVTFGALVAGSTVGANATNASASVNGALTSTTTHLWYFNNTNASTPYHVKLVLLNTPGVTSITSLTIGIDNGTSNVAQVTTSLGSLTKTDGNYVRIDPGATVRIYATHLVGLTFSSAQFQLEAYVADDTSESAVAKMRATFDLT